MGRTNKERVLDYLWSISPEYATNSQIRDATGIKPHQQVYLLTQEPDAFSPGPWGAARA